MFLTSITLILIVSVLILLIAELVFLSSFAPLYYRKGPFARRVVFKSGYNRDIIKKRLKDEKRILTRHIEPDLTLLGFKSRFHFFGGYWFNPSRYVLFFSERAGQTEIYCEIRPPYSAFLLPVCLVLSVIIDLFWLNPHTAVPDKIIVPLMIIGIGLVLFNVFMGNRKDAIKILRGALGASEGPVVFLEDGVNKIVKVRPP